MDNVDGRAYPGSPLSVEPIEARLARASRTAALPEWRRPHGSGPRGMSSEQSPAKNSIRRGAARPGTERRGAGVSDNRLVVIGPSGQ